MLGGGRLKRRRKPAQAAQSVFGMAVTITGDLESDDPIRIDGTMEGDVRGTVVTVTRKASVRGSIHADAVRIAGAVEGLVQAATVVVTRHARLTGDIICETLEIEAGADIGARCRAWRMDDATEGSTEAATPDPTSPPRGEMIPT
jgi:cytoskeletal protein CcmA (bactofilin family)